jgi:phosphonate transport system ATP-binding protein
MSLEAVATPLLVPPPEAPSSAVAVELQGLRFAYPHRTSLALEVDRLVIQRGERVALLGENGCGKTTLLRVMNGSLVPQSGTLALGGGKLAAADLRRREVRRRIGFIFQDLYLVERATVLENVLWGRLGYAHPMKSLLGFFSPEDRARALRALAEVGLRDLAGRRADTLSGGQKQRVAIARVLAQDAEVVLADEPVASLDPPRADEVLGLLSRLSWAHARTLVVSLHRPDLALRHTDRVLGLRAGRLVLDAPTAHLTLEELHTLYERAEGGEPAEAR